jgi:hypothetical protein
MHMPDRYMSHLLLNGRITFKWHGWNNECVTNHAIFASQGPSVIYHEDGTVEYKFYNWRGGRILRDDKSYKVVKFVFTANQYNSTSLANAVLDPMIWCTPL